MGGQLLVISALIWVSGFISYKIQNTHAEPQSVYGIPVLLLFQARAGRGKQVIPTESGPTLKSKAYTKRLRNYSLQTTRLVIESLEPWGVTQPLTTQPCNLQYPSTFEPFTSKLSYYSTTHFTFHFSS